MNTNELLAKARARIRRSPSEVFAAFADAGNVSKFWFTRRDEGLQEGESVTWFVGCGEDAYSFDVLVKEIHEPSKIVIEWAGLDEKRTRVSWSFEETEEGDTILTIEESGFSGNRDAIVERVLDSTCGFNQVIIAAKALVEYGIELNVVTDHA